MDESETVSSLLSRCVPSRVKSEMKLQPTGGMVAINDYLARIPTDMRASLERLRRTIRAAAPGAEEVVSYGMPAFKLNGMLVWYAGFKDHCSFFAGSRVVLGKFAKEVRPFSAGRGTLRFTPRHPIPATLVRRIVRARVAENESKVVAKQARGARRRKRRTQSGRGSTE